jgi:flagellar biosynthesis component FlhA
LRTEIASRWEEVYVLKKAMFALAFVVAMAPLRVSHLAAQFGQQQRPEQSQQEREMEERRQKEANKKRQDDIREDTQKLYQLATELKDAVDKSNEHLLSLDVVKKAEEVEKLAKKVKEKMKEGIGRPLNAEPLPRSPRPPFGPP